jgi:ubiquinone biosynthesis accessory factor UbiK
VRTAGVRAGRVRAPNWRGGAGRPAARSRGHDGLRIRLLDFDRHRTSLQEARVLNINPGSLDELASRIGKAIEASPARDIEKNVRSLLASGLSRLDLVTRAEFDVQAQVLQRTREKLERMEARVAELEARFPPPAQ